MALTITNYVTHVAMGDSDSLKTFVKNAYNIYFDGVTLKIVNAQTEKTVYSFVNTSVISTIYDAKTDTYPSVPGTLIGLANLLVTFFFRRLNRFPAGGAIGQGIVKATTEDFDFGWGNIKKQYKIYTKPQVYSGGNIAYSGFATDVGAGTDEAKWAVKKVLQDGTETWAGKTTFDKILDDYLSLSYS